SFSGSNIFFNNKHSLGTPIVSLEGLVIGIWRPPPGCPANAGTESEPTGAAPRRAAAGMFPVA
ncbi:hypothetical protein A2U01_0087507, partial [Trifolium medium]|nr:hypothetical protein [Trifolium medium]